MVKKKTAIPDQLRHWIDARSRFRLSHAHVQMARELGMNPRRLGKIDNHDQEPWKLPLPDFIAKLYFRRFRREMPDAVMSIEQIAAAQLAKKRAKKRAMEARKLNGSDQTSFSQS